MADYNGVTLPDAPADALVDKPYAVLIHVVLEAYNVDEYGLILTADPAFYAPASITGMPYDVLGAEAETAQMFYALSEDGTAWEASGEETIDQIIIPVGTITEGDITYEYTLTWTNHNVLYAGLDGESLVPTEEVYMAGTGVVLPPDEYSITREDVVFLADQTRRLTGGTGKLGFAEIKSGLEGVSTEPNLQDKTITENGTYTADDGYDGLGTVTVNAPVGSGLLFAGSASGYIPDIPEGEALSVLIADEFAETTATGNLTDSE